MILLCGDNKSNASKVRALIFSVLAIVLLNYLVNHIPLFDTINQRMWALINGLTGNGDLDHSSVNRITYIKEGMNLFSESPFLGKGANASLFYFKTYTHNNLVEILLNTGIIGFLIYYTPYVIYFCEFIHVKKDSILWLLFILYLWIFISGFGMVTYFEKPSIMLIMISISWLDIEIEKEEENSLKNGRHYKYFKTNI